MADLSQSKAAQNLFQRVKDLSLDVNFLVNNAGLLKNGFFTELSLEEQEKMIAVNVIALTSLTHLFANYMASKDCLLYTSPSPRDGLLSRMPSSA